MSEIAAIFWNNVLYKNLVFIQFMGILLVIIKSGGIRISLKKGFIYSVGLLLSSLMGWLFSGWIGSGYEIVLVWLFLISSFISIFIIQKLGVLTGEWRGFPEFILILLPMVGLQWSVWEQAVEFEHKIFMIMGNVVGFYLVFILVASVKEQIKIAEAPSICKKLPTLLFAIGFFVLAFLGFNFI